MNADTKEDVKVIRVRDLKRWGATCADLAKFRERFGKESVRLTRETIMANADLDLPWLARQLFEPNSDKEQKFWEGVVPIYNEARSAVNSQPWGAYLDRLRHEAKRGDSPPENGFTRLLGLNVPGNEAVRKRFQNAVAELFCRVYFGESD
jgi:hypothetical protein